MIGEEGLERDLEVMRPLARRTDPETSHGAATRARETAPTLRVKCLEALLRAGDDGLTDFELAETVHSIQTSAGKRRGELVALGLVEYAGVKRESPHGSPARVWRVTGIAHRYVDELRGLVARATQEAIA